MRRALLEAAGEMLGVAVAFVILALVACDQAGGIGTGIKNGAEEVGAVHGEILCLAHPDACGDVWMCEQEAENELGHVEICVQRDTPLEEVEALYGPCEPTPRHVGLCWWRCPSQVGANAFNGSWCDDAGEQD